MEERTAIVAQGDDAALKALEKTCLTTNAKFKNWTCTEDLMKTTKNGETLYMHCLPADITSVFCKEGEVGQLSLTSIFFPCKRKQASSSM